ncbi:hypothetical protein M3J09_001545 [Ascochyta lentis]
MSSGGTSSSLDKGTSIQRTAPSSTSGSSIRIQSHIPVHAVLEENIVHRASERTPPNDNTLTNQPANQPTNPSPPDMHATRDPWTIERITAPSMHEASTFINASRRTLFPTLGHDALLDDVATLNTSCVLVARDGESELVAAIAYTPFDYRFEGLPWPLGTGASTTATTSTSASTTSNGSSGSSSSNSSSSCSRSTYSPSPSPSPSSSSSSSSSTPSSPSTPSTPTSTSSRQIKTVEVLRLFVLPQHRRHGLAAALFQALKERAVAEGVQCMYLHTHPFLPGAIRFWEKQGFDVVRVDEEDRVWRTHHMRMMLGPS